jgi:hypothetical protein
LTISSHLLLFDWSNYQRLSIFPFPGIYRLGRFDQFRSFYISSIALIIFDHSELPSAIFGSFSLSESTLNYLSYVLWVDFGIFGYLSLPLTCFCHIWVFSSVFNHLRVPAAILGSIDYEVLYLHWHLAIMNNLGSL